VHDLQFVGAADRISNDPLQIEFRLRGWSAAEDAVHELSVAEAGLRLNQVVRISDSVTLLEGVAA